MKIEAEERGKRGSWESHNIQQQKSYREKKRAKTFLEISQTAISFLTSFIKLQI